MSTIDRLSDSQLQRYTVQAKSPGLCALIELVGLLVGFCGIGIIVGGRASLGVVALLGYWALLVGGVFCLMGNPGGIVLAPIIPLWAILSIVTAAQVARTHNSQLAERLLARDGDGPPLPPQKSAGASVLGVVAKVAAVLLGIVVAVVVVGLISTFLL